MYSTLYIYYDRFYAMFLGQYVATLTQLIDARYLVVKAMSNLRHLPPRRTPSVRSPTGPLAEFGSRRAQALRALPAPPHSLAKVDIHRAVAP